MNRLNLAEQRQTSVIESREMSHWQWRTTNDSSRGCETACAERVVACRRRSYSGEPLTSTRSISSSISSRVPVATTASTASTTSRRAMMMRSQSLSHSRLAASSCACFAPLPDYAKYQERKIQRALSRGNIFAEPSSPRFESRQTRTIISSSSMEDNNNHLAGSASNTSTCTTRTCTCTCARQPVSPTRVTNGETAATTMLFMDYPSRTTPPASSSSSRRSSMSRVEQDFSMLQVPITPSKPCKTRSHSTTCNTNNFVSYRPVVQRRSSTGSIRDGTTTPMTMTRTPMTTPTTSNSTDPKQIEISPGVTATLRSVDETMKAIRHDFFVPVVCYGCSLDLFCIADAKYVICPACRVVSPLLEDFNLYVPQQQPQQQQQQQQQHQYQRGLGLGVTYESLVTIQTEIMASGI